MHPNYLRYLNLSLQKTTTVFLDTAQLWYFLLTQTPTETTNDPLAKFTNSAHLTNKIWTHQSPINGLMEHHAFCCVQKMSWKKNGTSLSFLSTKGWARNNSSWAALLWHADIAHIETKDRQDHQGSRHPWRCPLGCWKFRAWVPRSPGTPLGHEDFTICYIVCTYPYNHIFSLHTSLVCVFEIRNPSPFQLNFYKMHPPHTSQGKRGMPPTWPSHQGMTHRWTCWFVGMHTCMSAARMPACGYASM